MNRISITFYDEVFEKVQKYADKKKISTAQAVREMVDIGLRVEAAASQNEGSFSKKGEIDSLGEMKELWKKSLSWQLESRYLVRHLVNEIPYGEKDKNVDMLKAATEKAQSFVKGLLKEEE